MTRPSLCVGVPQVVSMAVPVVWVAAGQMLRHRPSARRERLGHTHACQATLEQVESTARLTPAKAVYRRHGLFGFTHLSGRMSCSYHYTAQL